MRRSRWVRILLLVLAVVAGMLVRLGLPPRPATLPPGAAPLALLTQRSPIWRFPIGGCPLALLMPVRVERDGSTLALASLADGQRASVVWPAGFGARLLNGRAELVTPGGRVFAREGDVLQYLYGGVGEDGQFLICFGSPMEYEWEP